MAKHLTLTERAFIERALAQDYSFAYIGKVLDRSDTTIAREVKRYRVFVERTVGRNDCIYYQTCLRNRLCGENAFNCYLRCKLCTDADCRELCDHYVSKDCAKLNRAPYVCTGCTEQKSCRRNHAYYTAHRAQAAYRKELSSSRRGIRTEPERLVEIGKLLSPLIARGQSINQILVNHSGEIGLSEKTIYNYIDSNAFSVKNIDLPKKVVYRQRRKKQPLTKMEYRCRCGRTIEDFNSFLEMNPDIPVVEMDTVKGKRTKGKVLLTLIFRQSSFMLIFLMKDGTQSSVLSVFDSLTKELGLRAFRALFPVILTDNGVEFKDADSLEFAPSNCQRTRIFYCDPQASWQKPHIEKSHTLLRRILPKGTSFDDLTQEEIRLLSCHLNSVPREILHNGTPFACFTGEYEKKLLDLLTCSPVPPDEVCLKPALLKHPTK